MKAIHDAIETMRKNSADNCPDCGGEGMKCTKKKDAKCPQVNCIKCRHDCPCPTCAPYREERVWHEFKTISKNKIECVCGYIFEAEGIGNFPGWDYHYHITENNPTYTTIDSLVEAVKESGHWERFMEWLENDVLVFYFIEILTTRDLLASAIIYYLVLGGIE